MVFHIIFIKVMDTKIVMKIKVYYNGIIDTITSRTVGIYFSCKVFPCVKFLEKSEDKFYLDRVKDII